MALTSFETDHPGVWGKKISPRTHHRTVAQNGLGGRWLRPGSPAAHENFQLRLLPLGPDRVHQHSVEQDPAVNATCPKPD